MFNKLKDMELEYVRCFAQEKRFTHHIVFSDDKFRNTYTSNVTVLCKNMNDIELIKQINNEIRLYKKCGKDFLNFEINEDVSDSVINKLKIKPKRIDKFNYLLIKNEKYKDIDDNKDAILKRVESEKDFDNLIEINVKDNAKILGRAYSMHRIKRKIEAYKDLGNNLNAYMCINKEVPLGSCELLIKDNICKLEEFGVLEEYRGKGYGTHMLRQILKDNYNLGIEYTYLITEKSGDAESLYKRLGFIKSGEKTQLIW